MWHSKSTLCSDWRKNLSFFWWGLLLNQVARELNIQANQTPVWTLNTIICVKHIIYKVRAKALLMWVEDYLLLISASSSCLFETANVFISQKKVNHSRRCTQNSKYAGGSILKISTSLSLDLKVLIGIIRNHCWSQMQW